MAKYNIYILLGAIKKMENEEKKDDKKCIHWIVQKGYTTVLLNNSGIYT